MCAKTSRIHWCHCDSASTVLPVVTCTWPWSTTYLLACLCTPSSCFTSPHGSCSARTAPCSSSWWSSRSSSSPSGRVRKLKHMCLSTTFHSSFFKTLLSFVFRHAAGHSGEVRRHPTDKFSGGVCGRGDGCRRLPELHHLRGDVLCGASAAPCLHVQSVHGQESWLTRWERRELVSEVTGCDVTPEPSHKTKVKFLLLWFLSCQFSVFYLLLMFLFHPSLFVSLLSAAS